MVVDTKYYDVLGVSPTCDEKEIKTAFRKLSRTNHPDKYLDEEEKKKATIRFQEINEAHEILSDPEKRKMYDQLGRNFQQQQQQSPFPGGFPFAGGFPFGGIPGFQMFGGDIPGFPFFGGNQQTQKVITDINIIKEITLDELYIEHITSITFPKKSKCGSCKGEGTKNGNPSKCSECNGNGKVMRVSQQGNMILQNIDICGKCKGTGKYVDGSNKCVKCEQGYNTSIETINVKIDKNCLHMVLTGMLEDDAKININFQVKPHPVFIRNDKHLFMKLDITLNEAQNGFNKEIEFIDRSTFSIQSNKVIQPNSVKILKNKGFFKEGDLYILFNVVLDNQVKSSYNNNLEECNDSMSELVKKSFMN